MGHFWHFWGRKALFLVACALNECLGPLVTYVILIVTKLPRYHSNGVCPANLVSIFVATRLPRYQICKEKKLKKTLRCRTTIWLFGVSLHLRMIEQYIKKSKGVGVAMVIGHHTMG